MNSEKQFIFYLVSVFILSILLLSIGFAFHLYLALGPGDLFFAVLKSFFLWEAIIIFSLAFLIFAAYYRYLSYRRHVQIVSEAIFSALEHRFGNFLSTQKINFSLLDPPPKIKKRLEISSKILEADFRQILSLMKHLFLRKKNLCKTPIKVIQETIHIYEKLYPGRIVKLRILESELSLPTLILEVLLDLLLANAFKYSRQKIYFRIGKYQKRFYLVLINDLAPQRSPGSGLGIKIISTLCREYNLKFSCREKTKSFVSLIIGPRPFTIFSRDFF